MLRTLFNFMAALSDLAHSFFIPARVDHDIFDFACLLIVLATFKAFYWIISIMSSLIVSVLSSFF